MQRKRLPKKKESISVQLASNSRIQTLSDDVGGSLESINLNDHIKRTDAFIKNSESAYTFMEASLNSLDLASTQLQNIISVSPKCC